MDESLLIYKAELDHWWFQSRREIVNHLFWKKKDGSEKILSVGCGSGTEIEFLSQFGHTTGIDLSDKCIDRCKSKGLNAIKGDILNCPVESNSFDVVFAMDILEHIDDHQKAYSEIIRILKPGGRALITVPACMTLWSKFDELGDFPHKRRYSKKELKQLLTTQNVNISKLSYYNSLLFPLVYMTRKLNINDDAQLKVPNKIINKIFKSIFSSEKYLLDYISLPIGCSLIAICQKNEQ